MVSGRCAYDGSSCSDGAGYEGFSAPSAWNSLQRELKLQDLVTLSEFKAVVKCLELEPIGNCKLQFSPLHFGCRTF